MVVRRWMGLKGKERKGKTKGSCTVGVVAFRFFFFLCLLVLLRGHSARHVVHKIIRASHITSETHFVRSPRSAPFYSLACALALAAHVFGFGPLESGYR